MTAARVAASRPARSWSGGVPSRPDQAASQGRGFDVMLRPAVAQHRLRRSEDGRVVLELKATWSEGEGHVNLIRTAPGSSFRRWGRVMFYVDDVDAMFVHVRAQGVTPQAPPEDAPWGERYFHLTDPDGHELSFAQPLSGSRGRNPPP